LVWLPRFAMVTANRSSKFGKSSRSKSMWRLITRWERACRCLVHYAACSRISANVSLSSRKSLGKATTTARASYSDLASVVAFVMRLSKVQLIMGRWSGLCPMSAMPIAILASCNVWFSASCTNLGHVVSSGGVKRWPLVKYNVLIIPRIAWVPTSQRIS
jgi:hypothetical protein